MIKTKELLVCVTILMILSSTLSSLGEKSATGSILFNDKRWARIFGDQDITKRVYCPSFQPTGDGGYILLLNRYTLNPNTGEILLCKLDKYGRMKWIKKFDPPGDDFGTHIERSVEGDGYVIVGITSSYGAGREDIWLIKVDENGNEIWNKTIGGKNDDEGKWIQQTTDGGYIIAGWTKSYGITKDQKGCGWVIKIDGEGNEIWNRTFKEGSCLILECITQTDDGGYIAIGNYLDPDLRAQGICVIKLDKYGNVKWKGTYIEENRFHKIYRIIQSRDGGYVVAGYKEGYGHDISWIFKLDKDGNTVWETTFDEEYPIRNFFHSIQQTKDGGYIAVGWCSWPKYEWIWRPLNPFYYFEGWIVKLDAEGKMKWKRIIRAPFMSLLFFDVKQTYDGGFVVAGAASYTGPKPPEESDSGIVIAYMDAFIMKTDNKGRTNPLQLKLSAFFRCLTYWGITHSGMSLSQS